MIVVGRAFAWSGLVLALSSVALAALLQLFAPRMATPETPGYSADLSRLVVDAFATKDASKLLRHLQERGSVLCLSNQWERLRDAPTAVYGSAFRTPSTFVPDGSWALVLLDQHAPPQFAILTTAYVASSDRRCAETRKLTLRFELATATSPFRLAILAGD